MVNIANRSQASARVRGLWQAQAGGGAGLQLCLLFITARCELVDGEFLRGEWQASRDRSGGRSSRIDVGLGGSLRPFSKAGT
jgi:hypothetical protein